jgi:hypothetical protein
LILRASSVFQVPLVAMESMVAEVHCLLAMERSGNLNAKVPLAMIVIAPE